MRKTFFASVALIIASMCPIAHAQDAEVQSIQPTTWTIQHTVDHTEGGSAGTRGGVGAAAGWWLLGPLGAIAGAALGAGTTDDPKTTVIDVVVSGYTDHLSNGQDVRTRRLYRVGDVFDFKDAE